ncbi:hypothetical protein WICPIJ_006197 [Wickerhamomyces pijperi]|uniref:Uncharacterized protein n=1 Tax=Wickerhamomyces pijperi TaxID=599730 RepID=A0A9P8Q265_WICPI|nr:hypothetical protein WICPIJ_006197 [Wickerhamomyces pijperi]
MEILIQCPEWRSDHVQFTFVVVEFSLVDQRIDLNTTGTKDGGVFQLVKQDTISTTPPFLPLTWDQACWISLTKILSSDFLRASLPWMDLISSKVAVASRDKSVALPHNEISANSVNNKAEVSSSTWPTLEDNS